MKNQIRRAITLLVGGVTCLPGISTLPVLPAIVGTASVVVMTQEAEALPVDRARGRQGARGSRQTGRQVSRARRRGYHSLPVGYRPFRYGRYSYYVAAGRYYYPYMYSGRTVYITINVDASGNPTPPPAPGSIDIDING
ncbi:MAG: hypothetical protein ACI8XO_001490 [Verrucomicrobiales bacterium]|jgi:hypothetical protein